MPGAFDASAEFDHDPLPTAEEIHHSGQNVLRWLEAVATSEAPWPVDVRLVQEIHFRWFETTFPPMQAASEGELTHLARENLRPNGAQQASISLPRWPGSRPIGSGPGSHRRITELAELAKADV